jgi:hypothetical protein
MTINGHQAFCQITSSLLCPFKLCRCDVVITHNITQRDKTNSEPTIVGLHRNGVWRRAFVSNYRDWNASGCYFVWLHHIHNRGTGHKNLVGGRLSRYVDKTVPFIDEAGNLNASAPYYCCFLETLYCSSVLANSFGL